MIRTSLDHVAQGGSFAEEVISTIRTAKAFGTQFQLGAVYDSHVSKSYIADVKGGMVTGVGIGCFFFFAYASYSLAFSFGTTLMLQGHGDVGTIFNVYVLCIYGLNRKQENSNVFCCSSIALWLSSSVHSLSLFSLPRCKASQ
jgi:ATP-binding cassette subfamily B (MDR/TAP) protein 1